MGRQLNQGNSGDVAKQPWSGAFSGFFRGGEGGNHPGEGRGNARSERAVVYFPSATARVRKKKKEEEEEETIIIRETKVF